MLNALLNALKLPLCKDQPKKSGETVSRTIDTILDASLPPQILQKCSRLTVEYFPRNLSTN